MTVALIALFTSLAVCALIGWGFVRLLGTVGARLQRHGRTAAHRASDSAPWGEAADENQHAPELLLPRGAVETYFENGRWKNKVQGNSRASNVHDSWAAAVKVGREMASKRGVEHIITKRATSTRKRGTDRPQSPVESDSILSRLGTA